MSEVLGLRPDPEAIEALVGLPAASVERLLILATLAATRGNRTHAARILGITVRTLRSKLTAYGMHEPRALRSPSASEGAGN